MFTLLLVSVIMYALFYYTLNCFDSMHGRKISNYLGKGKYLLVGAMVIFYPITIIVIVGYILYITMKIK